MPGQANPGPEEQDGAQALAPAINTAFKVQLVQDHILPPGYSENLLVCSTVCLLIIFPLLTVSRYCTFLYKAVLKPL